VFLLQNVLLGFVELKKQGKSTDSTNRTED
jgi:hypothetical protein